MGTSMSLHAIESVYAIELRPNELLLYYNMWSIPSGNIVFTEKK